MPKVRYVPSSEGRKTLTPKYRAHVAPFSRHAGNTTPHAFRHKRHPRALWRYDKCIISPDETHDLLMVRLSRTRRRDPVLAKGADQSASRFIDRPTPGLTNDMSSLTFVQPTVVDEVSQAAKASRRRERTIHEAIEKT